MDTLDEINKRLNEASPKYRSAPFWAWNDSLRPERLTGQIDLMKEQGIGGFFIHSREGLETEYLSDEWMDCTDAALNHAEKSGMEVWIYDEDTWPSGSVGGAVSAANPQHFSAKALTLEISTNKTPSNDADILAVFPAEPYAGPGEEKRFLVFRRELSGPSEWYNGSAPSDNMNPEAVRLFLNKTHKAYADRFGEKLGTAIKGFFTDEPNVCDFFANFTQGRPWLPWTDSFSQYFKESRGYEILGILPFLFFKGEGSGKARYDYWLTLTEIFVSSYTRQLYDWCEGHDVKLTGHMLYENDLGYGVRCNGAVMPHYRYMHAPGIDLLGDQRSEYLTVKQCTSVANQFRREMVLSEMYGCTGWEFSFAGQKRLGDWQYVMGVNKRCQHLTLYSISGCRKRDYPPAFNYQSTFWEYSHFMEDYFARLGVCTTSGEVHRDILMIHPVGTFWMKSGSSADEDLSKVYMNMGWLDGHLMNLNREGDYYNQLTHQLLARQFDFDFGDELIMKDSAAVSGDKLQVGYHRYSYVIVPPLQTLMASTIELLSGFLESGGHIFWMTPYPEYVDAEKSGKIAELTGHFRVHPAGRLGELVSLMSSMVQRPVRICDGFGTDCDRLLSMTRTLETGRAVTIVNTAAEKLDGLILKFADRGRLTRLDLLSGDQSIVPVELDNQGGMNCRLSFEAEETVVFFIDETAEPEVSQALSLYYRHPHDSVELVYGFPAVSPVRLTSENDLTLDICSFRIADEAWSDELPVWQAQKIIRERFGMQAVHYNGAPQRYLWIDDKKEYPLSLRFSFTADCIPEREVFAAVEKSAGMKISCNSRACEQTEQWFIDEDFIKHRIPALVAGENVLEIDLMYCSSTELEDIYITGSFGVSPSRRIIEMPSVLERGDWSLQGLKHYPGSCIYQYEIPAAALPEIKASEGRRLMLHLGEFRGALAVIRIGGNQPVFALRETDIDVSGKIAPTAGLVSVEIEIVGNLRNLLGPLHRSADVCSRISWEDFHPSGAAFTPEYVTEAAGLMGEVCLYIE